MAVLFRSTDRLGPLLHRLQPKVRPLFPLDRKRIEAPAIVIDLQLFILLVDGDRNVPRVGVLTGVG